MLAKYYLVWSIPFCQHKKRKKKWRKNKIVAPPRTLMKFGTMKKTKLLYPFFGNWLYSISHHQVKTLQRHIVAITARYLQGKSQSNSTIVCYFFCLVLPFPAFLGDDSLIPFCPYGICIHHLEELIICSFAFSIVDHPNASKYGLFSKPQ